MLYSKKLRPFKTGISRQWIWEKILYELTKRTKENNYKELILKTSDRQTAAMKLYKNNGFKEFKKEIIDGYNCVWYKLII